MPTAPEGRVDRAHSCLAPQRQAILAWPCGRTAIGAALWRSPPDQTVRAKLLSQLWSNRRVQRLRPRHPAANRQPHGLAGIGAAGQSDG